LSLTIILVSLVALTACAGSGSPVPAAAPPAPPTVPAPAPVRVQAPVKAAAPIVASGATKSNSGGSVTVEAKWSIVEAKGLVFDIVMDTHSVDLDGYDLKALAVLKDGSGNEYRPTAWDSAAGGHHRTGKLAFALPDSLKQGEAKPVTLVVRKVAGVAERVFEWPQ